jgi:hypothetical protein
MEERSIWPWLRFYLCLKLLIVCYWEADHCPHHVGIAVGCFSDPIFPASVSGWEGNMIKWLNMLPQSSSGINAKRTLALPDANVGIATEGEFTNGIILRPFWWKMLSKRFIARVAPT